MLNPITNQRELVYSIIVDDIIPIEGAERVEIAVVGGWKVMVKKGQFQKGDLAIYFEIDSKVPEKEPFMFLADKKFKIKTQKYFKGKVISQGLLMSPEDFGWKAEDLSVCDFLTEKLGIVYATDEDNKRKANSVDKYKLMAQRHHKLFSKQPFRWLMKREWGKKLLFVFFGKKKDKKNGWPAWVVKTDEERCQNLPYLFPGGDEEWIATEKIDGTSTTFTMKGTGRKREFYICSRNVVFDKPDKKCYYETNVYIEMAIKYDIENVLTRLMNELDFIPEYVTIQGETYGASIQKRDYTMIYHDFMAFNLIFGMPDGHPWRLNPIEMTELLSKYDIPCVPIVSEHFKIPATCDELLELAGGVSRVDGGMREGLVFRSYDGVRSFKAVDNNFLLKYHN